MSQYLQTSQGSLSVFDSGVYVVIPNVVMQYSYMRPGKKSPRLQEAGQFWAGDYAVWLTDTVFELTSLTLGTHKSIHPHATSYGTFDAGHFSQEVRVLLDRQQYHEMKVLLHDLLQGYQDHECYVDMPQFMKDFKQRYVERMGQPYPWDGHSFTVTEVWSEETL